jgi:hypothetical protein
MSLWIELHLEFENAMKTNNQGLVRRILEFAAWCISEASGRLPNDTSTAVACAFYEHLPVRREYWPLFRTWFSHKEFAVLTPVFAYHLSAADLASLKHFYTTNT